MTRVLAWSLVFMSMLALGCSGQKTEQTQQTVSAAERSEYEGTAERKLAALGARIDSLKMELDQASESAKLELKQQIDELEVKRQAAERKMQELRAAGAERWNAVKLEMANMLDELDRRIR